MISAPALRCPRCKRVLEEHSWHDAESGECRRCGTAFEFLAFPALSADTTNVVPQAAVVDADSVCFFHAQNRAEQVCDSCGRLLCAVCAVPFMGETCCPSCIAVATKATTTKEVAVRSRVLHDSIALALAIVPLLVFFITLFTAPIALGWVIYAWNKPGSLVRGRRRWILVIAGLAALGEIVGWTLLFTGQFGRH